MLASAIQEAMADHWGWTLMTGVAILWIVFGSVKEMVKSANQERTRREIAAYIAEGSMTPEQGERILKAKPEEEE